MVERERRREARRGGNTPGLGRVVGADGRAQRAADEGDAQRGGRADPGRDQVDVELFIDELDVEAGLLPELAARAAVAALSPASMNPPGEPIRAAGASAERAPIPPSGISATMSTVGSGPRGGGLTALRDPD